MLSDTDMENKIIKIGRAVKVDRNVGISSKHRDKLRRAAFKKDVKMKALLEQLIDENC